MQQFHGSAGVLVRAYAYLRTLGLEGLRAASENADLNANYLRVLLEGHYDLPHSRRVMHEVVFSGSRQAKADVHTYDIAKRLIDHGLHPPTVYFPLIVEEALMIEPTETESREEIEAYAAALVSIAEEVERGEAEALATAPNGTPVGRLDEVTAARKPVLRWPGPAMA